jgi:excisionase family DNA binding protein
MQATSHTAVPVTLITVPEAMARIRIGRTTLYAAVKQGAFPIVKFGRATRIPLAEFDAWAVSKMTPPPADGEA